ncbi:hypothetical protein [Methanoculleus frigidifontis]|nr:hypothetical protein [Methanoculleus sp. FWC-SCC1]
MSLKYAAALEVLEDALARVEIALTFCRDFPGARELKWEILEKLGR